MAEIFDIKQEAIRTLAELLRETDLTEIELADGDKRVRLTRTPPAVIHQAAPAAAMAPAPASVPAQPAATPEPVEPAAIGPDTPGAVTSPMVGTVYLAPEPGAAPFVTVGDQVSEGQTLLIVEAMKVMNPIRAPRAGTVTRILVEDSNPVEFGDVLMLVT